MGGGIFLRIFSYASRGGVRLMNWQATCQTQKGNGDIVDMNDREKYRAT